jgi:mediator of RNA polymerase II transcription subunit 17, fungi type
MFETLSRVGHCRWLDWDANPSVSLSQSRNAYNCASVTLEFISLLLSKETPVQAGLTLSQQLRDLVGIGTLGATKHHDSNITDAKAKDTRAVAAGWVLMEINNTREAIATAGSLLGKEVEYEAKFWDDVTAVSQSGWSVCRLPQEKHMLGVRFGFSEGKLGFPAPSISNARSNPGVTLTTFFFLFSS